MWLSEQGSRRRLKQNIQEIRKLRKGLLEESAETPFSLSFNAFISWHNWFGSPVCLLIFSFSWSNSCCSLFLFHPTNRKLSNVTIVLHNPAMQAAYQYLLHLAGTPYVLAILKGVFPLFWLLLIFSPFLRLSHLLHFVEVLKKRSFFCILISRRKTTQVLQADRDPSLIFFSNAEVSHGLTEKTEYWSVQ